MPGILSVAPLNARVYYVASGGSDSSDGSFTKPFASIQKAINIVIPGDTIQVKEGRYSLISTISITKSGTVDDPYTLMAYPGQQVILDFSAQETGGSNRGIKLDGDHWRIERLEITGAGDNGLKIEGGSYNEIINCSFYRNRDSGVQIDNGASNNRIINCDSYLNADPPDYGDADGFAAKLSVGSGNYFFGCRAWKNCDDGWDGYLRGADNVFTTIENCWSFENGYLEDGSDPGPQANGNGFKMGGSEDKTLRHDHLLVNCLAFKNKVKGFDQNNNRGSMTLYNCTGHNNLVANYRISLELSAGEELVLKNCAELGDMVELGGFAIQEKNSWFEEFNVTVEDFISVSDAGVTGPRKQDGSLPDVEYLHLAETSDLVDAGVNIGLPFSGSFPDLGCFERELLINTGLENTEESGIGIYPNPAGEILFISLDRKTVGRIEVVLNDFTGRTIRRQILGELLTPGIYEIDVSAMNRGVYLLTLRNGSFTHSRMVLLK